MDDEVFLAHLNKYPALRKRMEEILSVAGDVFFRALLIDKENIPVEHIEEQLACSREITLILIDEMTKMIRDQIYRFFPSHGPKFVQDILKEDPYDGIAHIEVGNAEKAAITDARRVTFA